MRAPISVVIPTLNAGEGLVDCLSALGEGLNAGLLRELIITDGGSTDDTLTIADEAGAIILDGPASRGGQLLRGMSKALGEWLLVVHPDTRLQPGWSDVVLPVLPQPAAYFGRLRFDAPGVAPRVVERWANLRACAFGLPYGDQGLFIHRDLYGQTGGYRDIPLMEDVAIARALRGKLAPLPFTALTSAAKFQRQGWLRQGARNLIRLTRYLAGTDPHVLANIDRR